MTSSSSNSSTVELGPQVDQPTVEPRPQRGELLEGGGRHHLHGLRGVDDDHLAHSGCPLQAPVDPVGGLPQAVLLHQPGDHVRLEVCSGEGFVVAVGHDRAEVGPDGRGPLPRVRAGAAGGEVPQPPLAAVVGRHVVHQDGDLEAHLRQRLADRGPEGRRVGPVEHRQDLVDLSGPGRPRGHGVPIVPGPLPAREQPHAHFLHRRCTHPRTTGRAIGHIRHGAAKLGEP